ncbi:hypothetical protein [Actinomadura macra]|uniref:hypothetical protein n=1 Tax=Actinomadura macra TaxID=46164 RepID=UPI0008318E63|nr:hypothetical protein [Actinomadura macra]
MAVERVRWKDLPRATKEVVERHTGAVWSATTVPEGLNSAIAAVLITESGSVFVKGLHRDYPRRWTQDMEALINPYVDQLAPRLLWRVEGEWDVLGFELLDGRHSVYQPGSADLPKVAETITALGDIPCPDLPVKLAEHRWRHYVATPEELEWFKGDRLLHTDYNPLNVLMVDGRAMLIDWAWPTRGAGWIDPACLILRLMASGHSAESAEEVVADVPAWRSAPQEGLAVFARACNRMWEEIAAANTVEWTTDMAQAARLWRMRRNE